MPGPCEDCQLMFSGMPLKLSNADTTDGWDEPGQKLIIRGHVYKPDRKTPANEVLIYFYHTDKNGRYTPKEGMVPSSRKHGRLRGLIKTGEDGSYAIYTSRPAAYPEGNVEAHIHVIVKEPDMDQPYWIDEWIFDDDPKVTPERRAKRTNRGGDCLLAVKNENGLQVVEHDIILGLNIPGYPYTPSGQ